MAGDCPNMIRVPVQPKKQKTVEGTHLFCTCSEANAIVCKHALLCCPGGGRRGRLGGASLRGIVGDRGTPSADDASGEATAGAGEGACGSKRERRTREMARARVCHRHAALSVPERKGPPPLVAVDRRRRVPRPPHRGGAARKALGPEGCSLRSETTGRAVPPFGRPHRAHRFGLSELRSVSVTVREGIASGRQICVPRCVPVIVNKRCAG